MTRTRQHRAEFKNREEIERILYRFFFVEWVERKESSERKTCQCKKERVNEIKGMEENNQRNTKHQNNEQNVKDKDMKETNEQNVKR